MGLNEDLVRTRFQDIMQSLERLDKIGTLSRDAFLADQDTLDLACYRLLVAIEAALQICFHVSAQLCHRVPEEYAECFEILGEEGLIPAGLSDNLQQMARFRNLLVHAYWRVDYEQVYQVVRSRLGDLKEFVRAVGKLL